MAFIIVRSLILYLVVALALRMMGKRQIGELQPSELVITLLFSELASMPMQDAEQPILSGILPILALAAIEIAVSSITLKNVGLRHLLYGKPIVLVNCGKIDQKAMEKARVSIDDLIEAMRTSGIIKVADIDFAVLETNGNMSIIPKDNADTGGGLPEMIVVDGKILKGNMSRAGLSKDWLDTQMKTQGVSNVKEIFFLAHQPSGKTHFIKKDNKN